MWLTVALSQARIVSEILMGSDFESSVMQIPSLIYFLSFDCVCDPELEPV